MARIHGPLGYLAHQAARAGSHLLTGMEPYPEGGHPSDAFKQLDPRTATGAMTDAQILLGILMAGKAGVNAYQYRPRGSMSDEFMSAAKTLAGEAAYKRLAAQMMGSPKTGSLARIPGDPVTGHLTPMQRAYLKQLKFDPNRIAEIDNLDKAPYRFIRRGSLNNDPSTRAVINALGYTMGDPMMELAAYQGGTYRPIDEIMARLGQQYREENRLGGGPISPGEGANVETYFPLFKRNLSPNFRFSLPAEFTGQNANASTFVDYVANLLRGYGRDTGPPTNNPPFRSGQG